MSRHSSLTGQPGGPGMDRRTFLATSATGIALGSGLAVRDPGGEGQLPKAPRKPLVRTLGRTGLPLPVVSMGVMNAELPELVARSFELGVRHFDTAAYYQRGRNEEMVGKVLKQMGVRQQAIIATKVFVPPPQRSASAAALKRIYLDTLAESLRRLQTDYVDILYVHNATSLEDLASPGVREALATLKRQGKVRFIGFSTHINMRELIGQAATEDFWDVILTAFHYGLSEDTGLRTALQSAAARRIGLIAMKTQASQDWYRADLPEEMQRFYQGPKIHSAMLKWALRHDFITTAIPGYTTFQQMEENFAVASSLDYTREETLFLTDRKVRLAINTCRACAQCLGQCGHGVDIPALMRVHMYAASYRNLAQAGQTLTEIHPERGLKACSDCRGCTVACPHGLDVSRRLGELGSLFT
jgi:uncharacterized protein